MNGVEGGSRAAVRAPVFIVGAWRSGTTLLRVTLNRHSQLAMWDGETAYFRRLYTRRRAFGAPADPRNRERIVDAYLAIEPVRKTGLDLAVLRERLLAEGVSWRALFLSMIQAYAAFQGKPYAGEKTPSHALHVETLCEWFPGCAIIHLVRDPRDAVSSLMTMPWSTRSALMCARKWGLLNRAALAVSGRGNYLRVRYEDLAARPEEQLRRICGHIGLEYEESLLNANPAERDSQPHNTRSYERITPARLAVWRTALKPWQVAAVEAVAGRLMEEFGYERQTKRAPLASMARAVLEALVETTIQKFLRLPCIFTHVFQPTHLDDEQKRLMRASAIYARLRLLPRRALDSPASSE
ncbi:MAG: sulfotransferase [Bryobacteraceae bacterium]|jgi:hypothetical protein